MIGGDGVTPSEVSDGSGYLEDAVIGAGTEVQISHGDQLESLGEGHRAGGA